MENVQLKPNFTQVCVWPATIVGKERIEEFTNYMFNILGTRVQYLEEIKTFPDLDEEFDPVEGTGDRNDVFFAVHDEDVEKFAVPRLNYGIRWIEDVYGNDQGYMYPARVEQYKSW